MKRIVLTFLIGSIAILHSCVGPQGPVGPQGQPGINILGTTLEVEIDFTTTNDFGEIFTFTTPLEASDAVLVYILSGVENNRDIWKQLPQTYFFENGTLMYNFDFSVADFAIFLDGPIDYASLGDQWRINKVFRVIVLPSDFPNNRMDYSDYNAVTEMLGIKDSDFKKISPRK